MRILIAAGGTGGHLFPAIRLAEELESRGVSEILFITSRRGQDRATLERKGMRFCVSPVIPLKSRNVFHALDFIFRLFAGTVQSLFVLLSFRPQVAVGFGGYISGPALLSAHFLRIKTVIHEQNVYPGKANRMLARFVDRIAVSFDDTVEYLKRYKAKIVISGNPLRKDIEGHLIKKDNFTILIMGGSQGAHALNRLAPEAINSMDIVLKSGIEVIHISGYNERDEVKEFYDGKGIKNTVISFTEEMSAIYNKCDFVVSRAGAMTVSELLFLKKPSILVPYPYAGGHQRLNAKVMESAGLAVLLEEKGLTSEILRDAIAGFMDKDKLVAMARGADRFKQRDACEILIKETIVGQ